jgi:penicillin-binding protein 1A
VVTGSFLVGDEPTESCDVHTFVDVCTYAPISGTSAYQLAGSGISETFTTSISVLDVTRGEASDHVSPKDETYTLPWLMSYGYASYSEEIENPQPEEPEETEEPTDTEAPTTEPGDGTTEPTTPEAPQEPAAPEGGTTEPAA